MKVVAFVIADAHGSAEPDALASVHGESLLSHAVRGLLDCQCVDLVVVTVPARRFAAFNSVLQALPGAGDRVRAMPGGADRAESIRMALDSVGPSRYEVFLVHDVARAFTPPGTVQAVAEAVGAHGGAVVPVLPVTDTVKLVGAGDVVTGTEDRSRLRTLQAPLGCTEAVLRAACAHGGDDVLASLAGDVPVRTVPGHPNGMRVSTPFDLVIAEAMLVDEHKENR
ncbi:IspD/TarI family cytidylyltransferase [Amycolatopsis anabasis]|uniref:IspD/TarI family cytidylyltransferase n=1 Tax=Amycolatopsis anabasis TaxID=1840409 RepID=UPI00131CF663|nr:2-C-methyl-D-erythritol 4-phosphate cytidylyltransferase [Amycolatopsis anabasis]